MLLSAIAHAPLVAYIAHLATPPHGRAAAAPPTFTPPAQPIDVAFIVDDTPATAVGRTRGARRQTFVATSSTPDPGGTSVSRGTKAAPSATSHLRMRGPDLGLAPDAAERIVAGGGAAPPDELRRSRKLQPQPGGRAVVYDRVATLRVDADGKAHFEDVDDIDVKVRLPIPRVWEIDKMRVELGGRLTEWLKDPEAGKRYRPSSELPRHLQAVPGACDGWGAAFCDDPLAPGSEQLARERTQVTGPLLGGSLDITAWLHRKFIGDPYASRKLKLLDDTRDERVAMGQAYRAQQSARSGEYMRKNLERLWAEEAHPVARRAALFELWDECTDDAAGLRARAMVIGWIRRRVPAGSPDAYTAAELILLQERKASRAAFAPYDDGS